MYRVGLHSIHWGLLEVCKVSHDIIGEYYFPHPHSLGYISRGGESYYIFDESYTFSTLTLTCTD